MSEPRDRVLIVDDDPQVRSLLREQVLDAAAFDVAEARNGPEALQQFQEHTPDLIVLDLGLPQLSGQDVLTALRSQGYRGPLIVLDEGQQPRTVLDALRLGATDFVAKPLREAEMLAAVERNLETVRVYRERDALAARLRDAYQELEARDAQLATLYEVGQTVTQMRDLRQVTTRVLRAAMALTRADHAMLFLRDERSGQLVLHAGENMRLAMLDRLGQSVIDPLATLVMTSREPLMVSEEGLRRANAPRDLYAAGYVPLIVQKSVIGVLAVGNHLTQASFDDDDARLLNVLAGYGAIAIITTRLSQMLDQRARNLQASQEDLRVKDAERAQLFRDLLNQLHQSLITVEAGLMRLSPSIGRSDEAGQRELMTLRQQLRQLITHVGALAERAR